MRPIAYSQSGIKSQRILEVITGLELLSQTLGRGDEDSISPHSIAAGVISYTVGYAREPNSSAQTVMETRRQKW